MINGTTNLTTTLGVNAFASQGHFYGLNMSETNVMNSVPAVYDSNGELVVSSSKDKNTISVIEETGLTTDINSSW